MSMLPSRASSAHALGTSRQSFGILRKIREVDDMMLPSFEIDDVPVIVVDDELPGVEVR